MIRMMAPRKGRATSRDNSHPTGFITTIIETIRKKTHPIVKPAIVSDAIRHILVTVGLDVQSAIKDIVRGIYVVKRALSIISFRARNKDPNTQERKQRRTSRPR